MVPTIDDLVARQYPQIHAYVRLHTGAALRSAESCSDITQEVVIKILAARGHFEYRGEPEFRKWVIAVARSVIADRGKHHGAGLRSQSRTTCLDSHAPESLLCLRTPSRDACAREGLGRLSAALERLSEEHRQVITLVRFWGLGYRDAGKEMGKSEDAVRMLLYRALAQLAGQLQ